MTDIKILTFLCSDNFPFRVVVHSICYTKDVLGLGTVSALNLDGVMCEKCKIVSS